MIDLATAKAQVQKRIELACQKANRTSDDLTVVAVTKTHPLDIVRKACALSYPAIGENRVQEIIEKYSDGWLRGEFPHVKLHLIGHLQSNKVRKAVELVDSIDSVDSLKLAQTISRVCGESGKMMRILLEVNTSGEPQKFGLDPAETVALAREVNNLTNIELAGLMTIGPLTSDQSRIRAAFDQLRNLFNELTPKLQSPSWKVLSMGMSSDFEIAIEAGATEIRLGSVLFGPRS